VQFYRPDGLATTYGYVQYTNRKYDWTNFNFSETFANPSLATSYRAAHYGFIGRDNNYWAGNYGPEITNVSFNLKYRVDPCATDPTSSPACPGYAAAMSAKTATAAPVAATTAPSPTVETVVVNTTTPIPTVSTTSKTQADTVAVKPPSKTVAAALSLIARNQQQTQALQTSVAQAAVAEAASAATAAQQQAVAVATSAATMSQTLSSATVQTQRQSTTPAVAPVVSQSTLAPPVANNSTANNENKSVAVTSTTIQMPTPRSSTPVTANSTVVASVANVDTQQFSIPTLQSYFARSQPTSTQTVQDAPSIPALPPQPNKSATTAPVVTVVPITVTTTNAPVFSQANTDYQQSTMISAYTQPQNTMFYAMAAAPVEQQQQATAQRVSFARQAEVEQVSSTAGFMTNRTDPLNEVVESKTAVTTTNSTESAQTVRASVSDNELAGGVDISKLATTPAGYSNYTSLMLQDGKMYEPKEIYKNQKPVDNARALRQLSTDRLHQQMIEQQYRR
jgi:hypothetical protein